MTASVYTPESCPFCGADGMRTSGGGRSSRYRRSWPCDHRTPTPATPAPAIDPERDPWAEHRARWDNETGGAA